jgi:hypothetical protein
MCADRSQVCIGLMGKVKSPNRGIKRYALNFVHEIWKEGNVGHGAFRTTLAPSTKMRRSISGSHLRAI